MSIITHRRFGADIDTLRASGIDIAVSDDFSDITLDEPAYGQQILGDLTDDERKVFVELYRTKVEIERLVREYTGAAISRIGDTIRNSDASRPLYEAFQSHPQQMDYGSDANRNAFFRLVRLSEVLHAHLHWTLGERFGCHDWRIGVRSRFRAVKIEPKV